MHGKCEAAGNTEHPQGQGDACGKNRGRNGHQQRQSFPTPHQNAGKRHSHFTARGSEHFLFPLKPKNHSSLSHHERNFTRTLEKTGTTTKKPIKEDSTLIDNHCYTR